ncbi:non-hydrolyzing UDP-N-acetylglucosamine 2-epimerase [Chloroflexota bacterium]
MAIPRKVMHIVGARPNFVKVAPVLGEMGEFPQFEPMLVHTGQHYDYTMSKAFFENLELPRPDVYLGIGSGTHAEQTARIMIEFEIVCIKEKPELVIVYGDVNSTLACTIVAAKLGILVAHVEAGLRSFDRDMPEEINRLVTDSLSDYLFTTCKDANANLRHEGIPENKIYFVGNVMIDTLLGFREKAEQSDILRKLGLVEKSTRGDYQQAIDYAVLTLHRSSNVDDKECLQHILEAIKVVSSDIPVIFPIHPRTKKQIEMFAFGEYLHDFSDHKSKAVAVHHGIYSIEPLGYLDFIHLIANAKFVLTDSGGLQEETTVLGIPCLTLRDNTERPVTVVEGTNTIVGTEKVKIISESAKILDGRGKRGKLPRFWDGKASERIVKVLSTGGKDEL